MKVAEIEIRQATLNDLDIVVPLFDAYRQFYRQPRDLERVWRFLADRFAQNDSVIFLALVDGAAIGFTQLCPSFSSAAMARVFILFVAPEKRRTGVGSALLNAAAKYGRQAGAVRIVLSTEVNNRTAQALYETTGWKRDTVFCVYQFGLVEP